MRLCYILCAVKTQIFLFLEKIYVFSIYFCILWHILLLIFKKLDIMKEKKREDKNVIMFIFRTSRGRLFSLW